GDRTGPPRAVRRHHLGPGPPQVGPLRSPLHPLHPRHLPPRPHDPERRRRQPPLVRPRRTRPGNPPRHPFLSYAVAPRDGAVPRPRAGSSPVGGRPDPWLLLVLR